MRLLLFCCLLTGLCGCGSSKDVLVTDPQVLVGDWRAEANLPSGRRTLVLHVGRAENGALRATLDSPDTNTYGLAVNTISLQNGRLRFRLEVYQAEYDGLILGTRDMIRGRLRYDDGSSYLVTFERMIL